METLPRLDQPLRWIVFAGLALAACAAPTRTGAPPPARVLPPERPPERALQTGKASWYGQFHHGKPTASGEVFDMNAMTAAHRTLPLGTRVRVTNLANGRSVDVRINDRGPAVPDRVIDLSYAAARALGGAGEGVFSVRIAVLE